ncbi:MAG: hypothetical protein LBQ43_02320, partial [Holosporales bacterium]|nr:hypothetical protein [Holosporales bacterium]
FEPKNKESIHVTQTDHALQELYKKVVKWTEELERVDSFEAVAEKFGASQHTVKLCVNAFARVDRRIKSAILNGTLSPKFNISDFTRKSFPHTRVEQLAFFGVGAD